MKYFAIQTSLNKKILGKYPPVKGFIHHCNVDEEPKFIDKFVFEKIEIQPILSNVILYTNAKQTDLIDTLGDVGFKFGYLISDKFKQILDQFNCYGFQFFKTYNIQNNQKNFNYWQTNIYDFPYHCIDFKNTSFWLKDRDINRNVITEIVNFNDMNEFNVFVNNLRYPKMISFKEVFFNVDVDLDFFSLRYMEGAHRGIVSERLKNELEKNEITGIEFRPIEIPLNDWHAPGGEREKIYGKV